MNRTNDFEGRWIAWQRRGDIHDRMVRQRLAIVIPVMVIAAAMFYAFYLP
jgi:hypothetical protein